jgi:hypothetical protein
MIMSTLVSRPTGKFRDELHGLGRIFTGAFERFVAARQERANSYVQTYLARLSDSDLAKIGYSGSEIAKIKEARGKELPYHI